MRPPGGAVAVAAMVLPLIVLCKLWWGRRNTGDRNNDNNNASQQPDSTASLAPSEDTAGSSSAFLPTGEYEVFLSFRGPDTRDRITDILYRFLLHLKIHTFKDDEELRKGEGIWPGLVRAIDQSKIYVPIFSENYAHSKWCLKELAEMVRRCHEPEPDNRRPIILPIFYKVDPRDVRHQTGSYKEAFQHHEKNYDKRVVQEWKDALNEVGSLKGWHVKSDNEQGKYADLVLDNIWSHLRSLYYTVETDELVAIDGRVEEVVRRLSLDSEDVIMVGLHGIGGIGKTTLAKAVYNKILLQFDRCSFLENIRETQQQHDGILKIQHKLIKDAMRKEEHVVDISEGRRLIDDRVSRFKILIVLDDVDEKFVFEEILGNPRSFISGSRFIITSRDCKLLSTLNGDRCELFDVQALSPPHSLKLFSKHAFKKDCPPPDYESLSNDIVSTTGGLPLTLKVVGSLLYREGKSVWKEKLLQLREMLDRDVMDRLKISYDALEYEAKEIFLDIACLYIGEEKERPFYMWSDCRFYPTNNINLLIQRSMIKIGYENEFQMHDQLRDMGREIVRRENIEHPWMRSRIWTYKTAWELLHEQKGTGQVKAIRLVKPSPESKEDVELKSECFVNLSELRYFEAPYAKLSGDFANLLPNIRWLRLRPQKNVGRDDLINFHMKNLVILELHDSDVGNNWVGWTQIKMANKLKVLDLSHCYNLTKLPKLLESESTLEVLDLTAFKGRIDQEELDIGKLRNLSSLLLSGSSMKRIVGGTIGILEELRVLDVSDCKCENLEQVLVDVHKLQSLQILRTSSSNKQDILMGKLPISLKELSTSSPINNLSELIELERLQVKHCGCGLEIPPAEDSNNNKWWKSSKLKLLELYKVSKMWSTNRNSSRLPSSLTSLTVEHCAELEWLPNLENLENLTDIIVRHCPMPREIQGLGGLKALQTLRISHAANLRELDKGLHSLRCLSTLQLIGCGVLGRLSSLESLTKLDSLWIQECPLLTEIEGIGGLTSLQKLEIHCAGSLIRIDGLGNLISSSTRLKSIIICTCLSDQLHVHDDDDDGNGVGRSGPRGVVKSLKTLTIQGCTSQLLQDGLQLPHLSKFPMLKSLTLEDVNVLEIPPAEDDNDKYWWKLSKLEILKLDNVSKMWSTNPNNSRLPSSLTSLVVEQCAELEWLPDLENLENLTVLDVKYCLMLREIQGLGGLKSLQTLSISYAANLRQLDKGLCSLRCLSTLKLQHCGALERLSSLESLINLVRLRIEDCPLLMEIEGIGGLTSLQELKIASAKSLTRINGLGNLLSSSNSTKLKSLMIWDCPILASLSLCEDKLHDDGNGGGPIRTRGVVNSLETIEIRGCTSLLLLDGLQLPHLSKFPMLKSLALEDVKVAVQVKKAITVKQEEEEVSSLEGLGCLEELEWMRLGNLPSIERLPSLSKLGNLNYLFIKDMPRLQEIEGLAGLKSLYSLVLIRCTSLERVDGISGLEELETVIIQGCPKLLEKLRSLISNLRKLRDLSIRDMPSLREIDDSFGLANLKSLEWLDLTGCSSLERLTVNLPSKLKRLYVGGCTSLTNLSQLRDCLPRTSIDVN